MDICRLLLQEGKSKIVRSRRTQARSKGKDSSLHTQTRVRAQEERKECKLQVGKQGNRQSLSQAQFWQDDGGPASGVRI